MTSARLPGFNGVRVRDLRRKAGLSTRDMGDLVDASERAVQSWESGHSSPDPRRATKLADALGVAVRELTTLRDAEIGLVEMRALRGLVRSELARVTEIPANRLGHIELGHRRPTSEQAERIGAALGVSADRIATVWHEVRARRLEQLQRATQRPAGPVGDDNSEVAR